MLLLWDSDWWRGRRYRVHTASRIYLLIVKGTYFKNSAVKWSNIRFVMQSSSHNKMWQCAKSAPRPACVPGHFTTRRAYPLPSTQYPVRIPRDQRPRRLSVHGSRSHRQSLPNQVTAFLVILTCPDAHPRLVLFSPSININHLLVQKPIELMDQCSKHTKIGNFY